VVLWSVTAGRRGTGGYEVTHVRQATPSPKRPPSEPPKRTCLSIKEGQPKVSLVLQAEDGPVPKVLVSHRDLEGETETLDEILAVVAVVDVDVDDAQLGPAGADDEADRERQPRRPVRVLRVVPAGELD
jgi:hypothetical protein